MTPPLRLRSLAPATWAVQSARFRLLLHCCSSGSICRVVGARAPSGGLNVGGRAASSSIEVGLTGRTRLLALGSTVSRNFFGDGHTTGQYEVDIDSRIRWPAGNDCAKPLSCTVTVCFCPPSSGCGLSAPAKWLRLSTP